MATINTDRIFAWAGNKVTPPAIPFPDLGSNTGDPGDIVIASSGKADYPSNTPTGNILGLLEEKVAIASTADAPVTVSLALPHILYIGSTDAATTYSNLYTATSANYDLQDDSSGLFAIINIGASAQDTVKLIAFASDLHRFEVGSYIGKADTSVTAGSITTAQAQLGVSGDTSPRMAFTWNPADLALFD